MGLGLLGEHRGKGAVGSIVVPLTAATEALLCQSWGRGTGWPGLQRVQCQVLGWGSGAKEHLPPVNVVQGRGAREGKEVIRHCCIYRVTAEQEKMQSQVPG